MNPLNLDHLENRILPRVEKPSRYLGNELNTVHKNLSEVDLRMCLAFPDSYDVGLGNLGLQILYQVLNRQKGIWAERAFAPNPDLERQLRRAGFPLFSLESRTPLGEFDAIGFTLQWELTYTNILNMLDMAGISILAAERQDASPIILAGGPCVFNPEPLADFVDAFVIGDGEDVILEIAEALRAGKGKSRADRLGLLAEVRGVYVPALYPMQLSDNGVLTMPPGRLLITKRTVADLNAADFPTDYIVPFTRQIHDRVSLEVLRGCTQGCRFCQAGMTTRPVRERSLENLDQLMEETIRKTGYEELSLVSLSTCDYSKVKSLIGQSVRRAIPEGISVGLPSLRLDSFSVEMADMISVMGKSGLTFAPEAATNRMRSVINKFIPDEELLEMAREAYARGWKRIKLYFMIGLPTEREEDVLAIADLANRVLATGRSVKSAAQVNLGVSTFVPKPHTPFQWERQVSLKETEDKQNLLSRKLRSGIKFGRHDARESFLEGVLSRADRRAGKLLLEAFRLGCRFDGWSEYLNWPAWQEALLRWELDPEEQLRSRKLKEPLPWDHIDILIPKAWQEQDYWKSRGLEWFGDCRQEKCNDCGVIDVEKNLCVTMLKRSRKGAKEEDDGEFPIPERLPEPLPAARVHLRFSRIGKVRLLSHLETVNVFLRAIRRARLPISYSQGFNPLPKVAFNCALPVGVETEGDYVDLTFRESITAEAVKDRLSAALPSGFAILDAAEVPLKAQALMAGVIGERYTARLQTEDGDTLAQAQDRARDLRQQEALWVEKTNKKGRIRRLNILPSIRSLLANRTSADTLVIEAQVVQHETRASIRQILEAISPGTDFQAWLIRKTESYVRTGDELCDPLSVYREPAEALT